MFTGIVRDVGRVKTLDKHNGHWRIELETSLPLEKTDIGASICCGGCCLTVVEKTENSFWVDVSLETLDKTGIGKWEEGTKVNLEPSLKIGDELGGHLVSGHVDGQAVIQSIEEDGDSWKITFSVGDDLSKYIAPKGSVTIEGISLTVNTVEANDFTVNIIPHTWEVTSIHSRKEGDRVNVEIDQIARYVERLLSEQNRLAA